jgi:hypothetical protein
VPKANNPRLRRLLLTVTLGKKQKRLEKAIKPQKIKEP